MKTWQEMTKPERLDAIKLAWEIAPSAQGIASHIRGSTRNAIIGTYQRNRGELKMHPLGNYRTPHPKSDPNRPQAPKKYKTGPKPETAQKPQASKPIPVVIVAPISKNIPLVDLGRGICRFGTGENPWRFCGHDTENESLYCPHHRKIVYQPRSN